MGPINANHVWSDHVLPCRGDIVGVERFPKKKSELKKRIKTKEAGFNVYLTPKGSTSHTRCATMDPDCLAIAIPNSSQAFILVNREDLEERSEVIDNKVSISLSEEVALRAIELIDAELAGKSKLIGAWKGKLKNSFEAIRHRLSRVRRLSKKSKHVRELEAKVRSLENQANRDAGTIVEMQIAGLIPMSRKPPIPLRNIHQMHYGCDWLSMAWKRDELHLFFIESNLSRTETQPSLTNNEQRLRNSVKGQKVFCHHVHHWVDEEGGTHWDR